MIPTKYCQYIFHLCESLLDLFAIGTLLQQSMVSQEKCPLAKFKQKRCNSEKTFILLICNRKKYLKCLYFYLAATDEAA